MALLLGGMGNLDDKLMTFSPCVRICSLSTSTDYLLEPPTATTEPLCPNRAYSRPAFGTSRPRATTCCCGCSPAATADPALRKRHYSSQLHIPSLNPSFESYFYISFRPLLSNATILLKRSPSSYFHPPLPLVHCHEFLSPHVFNQPPPLRVRLRPPYTAGEARRICSSF